MQRKTLGLLAGSLLALCSTAFVVAALPADDETAPLPAATGDRAPADTGGPMRRAPWRHAAEARPLVAPEVRAAVRDLRALDRLYYLSGRGKELPALYQDLLAKTRNPQLRSEERRVGKECRSRGSTYH